jgi:hypothetical protein
MTNENSSDGPGISLGNFINIDIPDEITGDFTTWVTTHPIYMHEYGHYRDGKKLGVSYLFAIGVPSIFSAAKQNSNHYKFWTEMRANRNAKGYFGKYYGVDWDSPYPHGYKGTGEWRQDDKGHWYWHDYTYEDYYPTK